MRILFDNTNINSRSGPNAFAKKLSNAIIRTNEHNVVFNASEPHDVCLTFIENNQITSAKRILRLDGIYFNSDQPWEKLNHSIKQSYNACQGVVFQTTFNKRLSEKFFGIRNNTSVIPNGTDVSLINSIAPAQFSGTFSEIWCSAASWRPHKRLEENIRYFLEHSPKDAILIILGHIGYQPQLSGNESDRVVFLGEVSWENTISIFKACKKFLHLAYFDHCPNVVVDARAAGCEIVVTSSGGTKEIAGPGAIVIEEEFDEIESPIKLYYPPRLDFARYHTNSFNSVVDVNEIAKSYIDVLIKTV